MFTVPEYIAPPETSALSSTSLKVKWNTAEGQGIIARGEVTEYRVNLLTKQANNPYAPPLISQVKQVTRGVYEDKTYESLILAVLSLQLSQIYTNCWTLRTALFMVPAPG